MLVGHFSSGERCYATADERSARLLDRLWASGLLEADGRPLPSARPVPAQWPDALLVKLTGSCNLECDYCYDFDQTRWRARLTLDRVCEVLDDLSEHAPRLSLVFHGGEPLLRFDLLRQIVAYAEGLGERGVRVGFSIQTNATRLTPSVVAFLEEHDFSVGISLDGHTEDANALRPVRRGRSPLASVEHLMDAYPSFVRDRCGFLAVVTRTSAPYLPGFARWLQDFGVGGLSISFLDLIGRGGSLADERLEPEEAVGVLSSLVDQIRTGEIGALDVKSLTSRINNLFTFTARDLCHKGPCGASGEFLVLDAAGGLRSCDCTYDGYFELATGGPVPDADHPRRLAVIDRVERLRHEGGPCSRCALVGLCGGTCVAKAIARTGKPVSVDPVECALSRYLYPQLLAEFAAGGATPLLDYYRRHRNVHDAGVAS